MDVSVEEWATTGEKILAIRKAKKLNQTDFGRKVGIPQGNLSDYEKDKVQMSDRIARDIIEFYKVKGAWWDTGEGEMFYGESDGSSTIHQDEPSKDKTKLFLSELPEKDTELYIPYYNVEITAGRIELYFDDVDEIPEGYIYAPQYRDCIACHVKGDSMYDRIFPGSRLFVYYMKNKKYIDYGQIYLVVLDGYRLLKYIHPHPTDETKVLLSSYNKHYSDWPVERADILHLFLVKGYENQNAN